MYLITKTLWKLHEFSKEQKLHSRTIAPVKENRIHLCILLWTILPYAPRREECCANRYELASENGKFCSLFTTGLKCKPSMQNEFILCRIWWCKTVLFSTWRRKLRIHLLLEACWSISDDAKGFFEPGNKCLGWESYNIVPEWPLQLWWYTSTTRMLVQHCMNYNKKHQEAPSLLLKLSYNGMPIWMLWYKFKMNSQDLLWQNRFLS